MDIIQEAKERVKLAKDRQDFAKNRNIHIQDDIDADLISRLVDRLEFLEKVIFTATIIKFKEDELPDDKIQAALHILEKFNNNLKKAHPLESLQFPPAGDK